MDKRPEVKKGEKMKKEKGCQEKKKNPQNKVIEVKSKQIRVLSLTIMDILGQVVICSGGLF